MTFIPFNICIDLNNKYYAMCLPCAFEINWSISWRKKSTMFSCLILATFGTVRISIMLYVKRHLIIIEYINNKEMNEE